MDPTLTRIYFMTTTHITLHGVHGIHIMTVWSQTTLDARLSITRNWFTCYAVTHGLQGWTIEFDRARTRCGITSYKTSRIYVSRIFIGSATTTLSQIKNILLHEIAHALTPGAKHGPTWVQKALAIGCDGKRYSLPFVKPRWTLGCSRGCFKRRRFNRTKINPRKVCAKCHGALEYYRSITV